MKVLIFKKLKIKKIFHSVKNWVLKEDLNNHHPKNNPNIPLVVKVPSTFVII